MNNELKALLKAAWLEVEGNPPDGYEDCREELMDDLAPIFQKFADLLLAPRTDPAIQYLGPL